MVSGGPDGELAASLRYLNQRYVMPYGEVKGILTDIGTEESEHQRYILAIYVNITGYFAIETSIYATPHKAVRRSLCGVAYIKKSKKQK